MHGEIGAGLWLTRILPLHCLIPYLHANCLGVRLRIWSFYEAKADVLVSTILRAKGDKEEIRPNQLKIGNAESSRHQLWVQWYNRWLARGS